MIEMRRKDRAITDDEALSLLNNCEYGTLSTISENGEPYGIPLSYCMVNDAIYIHSAAEGKKLDCFKNNKSVSFCVVGKTKILPDKFSTKYESVIVTGYIEEVFGEMKQRGMEGLIDKYSPEHIEKGLKYIADAANKTKVFKISVNNLTGKARK